MFVARRNTRRRVSPVSRCGCPLMWHLIVRCCGIWKNALSKLRKESRPHAAGLQCSTSQGAGAQHPVHFSCAPARSTTNINKQQSNTNSTTNIPPLLPPAPAEQRKTVSILGERLDHATPWETRGTPDFRPCHHSLHPPAEQYPSSGSGSGPGVPPCVAAKPAIRRWCFRESCAALLRFRCRFFPCVQGL